MPDWLPIALLALAPGDSLKAPDGGPVPLIAVDGPQVAWTVAQYLADTTVAAWRVAANDWLPSEPLIEDPSEGQVLIPFIPRAGEDQSTGVGEAPGDDAVGELPPQHDGWCGRLFSIEWR